MNTSESGEKSLQEKAEASIQRAKELILESIPSEEVIAIYVKGSYVHGDMQQDSDVDVVAILKNEKFLPALYELEGKFGNTTNPPMQIVGYALEELQTGKWSPKRIKNSTPMSVFVKHLNHLPIIYGSKPEGELFTRTDKKDLTALLSAFRSMFFPGIQDGTFKFMDLVKQVLWLSEREQRALGNNPDYSWQKLADSISDKNHIVHLALKYRKEKEVSEDNQTEFLKKTHAYVESLENTYK